MKLRYLTVALLLSVALVGCGDSTAETKKNDDKVAEAVHDADEGDQTVTATMLKSETKTVAAEYVGTLGKDLYLSDLESCIGKEFDATMIYWSETGYKKYPSLFMFYEKGWDGYTTGNFYVKDQTDTNVLAGIKDYDYKDNLAVTMRLVLDDIELVETKSSGILVQYQVSAQTAEILPIGSAKSKLASNDYFTAGNTINYNSGLSISIYDTGTCYVDNSYCAYIEIEAVNNGNEDVYLLQADFYGDDYSIDRFYTGKDDALYGGEKLAPNRRIHGVYYADLGWNDYTEIEASLGDAIIMVQYPMPVTGNKTIYGTYYYDNGVSAVIDGDVGIYTDTDESYLYLEVMNYGSERYSQDIQGILEPIGEKTYHLKDIISEKAEFEVTFMDGGMELKLLTPDMKDHQVFEGHYDMMSELDFSQVG